MCGELAYKRISTVVKYDTMRTSLTTAAAHALFSISSENSRDNVLLQISKTQDTHK